MAVDEVLDTLVDKQDTFEIVRDQIGCILADETASQQALAIAAAKDPDLWKLRVFVDRSNPWEEFLNDQSDLSPIVNVWYDSGVFPGDKGDTVTQQMHEVTYNIDCYGRGLSADDGGSGHIAGDKQGSQTAQRAIRLVRNFLMSNINTYLQLRGTVWQRWFTSITVFQPQLDVNPLQQVTGARLSLRVRMTELSPQQTPGTLCEVGVDINRAENGEILAQAEYVYN